jgi:hypothetical protein
MSNVLYILKSNTETDLGDHTETKQRDFWYRVYKSQIKEMIFPYTSSYMYDDPFMGSNSYSYKALHFLHSTIPTKNEENLTFFTVHGYFLVRSDKLTVYSNRYTTPWALGTSDLNAHADVWNKILEVG